jgi:hypothetical protein
MRKMVVDYKTYNIKVKDLKLDFGKGSSLKDLINWADKNKYHYTLIERHAD